MTQEEKAKRYDEAIKVAEPLYKAAEPMSGCNVIIETLFPELKESEDERIRKEIINYFEHYPNIIVKRERRRDWIAWLERQGEITKEWSEMKVANIQTKQDEQKPIIDIDKMVDEFAHTEVKGYGMPAMIEVDAYRKGVNDALCLLLNLEKQGEQKPADKIEPKFHEGEWITIKE